MFRSPTGAIFVSCAVFVFYNKRRWTNHVRLWFCLLNFCSGFCCLTSSSQTENVNTEKQISESYFVESADLFKMFNNLQRISLTCCKFKACLAVTILFLRHELEKRQRAVYEWENINVFLSLCVKSCWFLRSFWQPLKLVKSLISTFLLGRSSESGNILQIAGQTDSHWVSNNSKSIFTHGLSDGFASEADLAFLLKGLVALGERSW